MPELTEKEFKRLKAAVEDAKEEASEAAGAKKQLLRQLKEEFNCDTVEEAIKHRKQLVKELTEARAKYDKELKEYERTYKNDERD